MFNNKSKVKVIALAIAAVFILGVAGVAVTQTGSGSVSAAAASNIGVVNKELLFDQHPDTAKARQIMTTEQEQASKDFETKAASMNDKEKQDYANQLQQRLMVKSQELRAGILEKIDAAVKAVAESKGLSVVIDKSNVVYGGNDITDDVLKKLK